MWWLPDVIFLALFLIGVFVYEIVDKKIFSVLYVALAVAGGWFVFDPFKNFVLAAGWKTIVLHWIPLYLGIGVGVALLKWLQLTLKVASHIGDTKEDLKKIDFQHLVNVLNKTAAEKEYNETLAEAKRVHSNLNWDSRTQKDKGLSFVAPEPPAEIPATTAQIDAFRREHFIKLWNKSEREHDLPSVNTDSKTNWNDPEIITELLTPRAKKNVSTISFWVIQWPFVVVSTVIGDLLLKFGKHVAKWFDHLFTNIGKRLVRHASKGI